MDEPLLVEERQGVADGDARSAIPLRQLRLGGHRVGYRELTRQDPRTQVVRELTVERLAIPPQRRQQRLARRRVGGASDPPFGARSGCVTAHLL